VAFDLLLIIINHSQPYKLYNEKERKETGFLCRKSEQNVKISGTKEKYAVYGRLAQGRDCLRRRRSFVRLNPLYGHQFIVL
jgi:hypothetical protein